jgi:hypothetical protein
MIDGVTVSLFFLKHNYEAFLIGILKRAKTVIFSSTHPKQKGEIVRLL